MSELADRLKKNYRRLAGSFKAQNVEAWRLYNHDIPAYPYLIDLYGNYCVLYDQGQDQAPEDIVKRHHQEATTALVELLKIPEDHIVTKERRRQKGDEQYEVLEPHSEESFIINEGPLRFEVNLFKYLDTGLFLDHRPLRRELLKVSQNRSVLNLFCYTGSISVAAAKGGASKVTSIDMSNPYLQWARRNFLLNEIPYQNHQFEQADLMWWLNEPVSERWDVIVLDPPSFSNSKRMEGVLDVQRDHGFLIQACLNRLTMGGTLYFSTNKRRFKLDPEFEAMGQEISKWTVPVDFAGDSIHRAWRFTSK